MPAFCAYVVVGTQELPDREAVVDALGVAERRGGQAGEREVGGCECVAAGEQVVAGAVDGAQAVGAEPVGDLVRSRADQRPARIGRGGRRCMVLGDLDLLEDVGQVRRRDREARAHRSRRGLGRGRRRQGPGNQPQGQQTSGESGARAPGSGVVDVVHVGRSLQGFGRGRRGARRVPGPAEWVRA